MGLYIEIRKTEMKLWEWQKRLRPLSGLLGLLFFMLTAQLANSRQLTPTPVRQPVKEDFYQRYFRKGKAVEEQTPGKNESIPPMIIRPTPTSSLSPQEKEIRELIHDLGAEQHRRMAAVERLAVIGEKTVPYLRQALHDPYKFTRIGALNALGYIYSESAVPDINQCLQDPEAGVRAEAIKTLGRMKYRSSTALIILRLSDSDIRVRREAVIALGRISSPEACQALTQCWDDQPAKIKQQIAQIFPSFEGPKVVPFLLKAAADPDRNTRIIAIRSLGEIGDPAAIPKLKALSQNPDQAIRHEAINALGNMNE